MKAFIYCRVSTEEQAETGHSLETQEKFCRQFAQRNDYKIAGIFRDEGKSGTNLDRPAIKELLSRVQKEGSIDAVIVQETDRLARNTRDHLTVRALLEKSKVKFISAAQPMLDDSPEGKMIDTIIASVNQFQSDINSRKISKGMQEKFDSGYWPGRAPLGYLNKTSRNDRRTIIPDPNTWPFVEEGFKLYLTGHYSAMEVADILYEKGLKSRTQKKMCNSIITDLLRNPFYAGIMTWKGQTKIGSHKTMITPEEHYQILRIFDAHNLHACRQRKYAFLLRGFAFCNLCGGKYTAEKHPKRNNVEYYHCTLASKVGRDRPHSNKGQNVQAYELEKQVQEQFKNIQFTEKFTAQILGRIRKVYEEKKRSSEAKKRVLRNRKMAVEKKRDIIEEKLLAGVISDKDFTRLKIKIDGDLDRLQDQLDELSSSHDCDMGLIREILKLSGNIYETYKKAHYELKRHFLGLFWEKFLIQDKRIVQAIPNKLIAGFCENSACYNKQTNVVNSSALYNTGGPRIHDYDKGKTT